MALAAGAAAWGGATGDMSPEVRGWFLWLAVVFMVATLLIEGFHGAFVPYAKGRRWPVDEDEGED